jgi:hypothetical protein
MDHFGTVDELQFSKCQNAVAIESRASSSPGDTTEFLPLPEQCKNHPDHHPSAARQLGILRIIRDLEIVLLLGKSYTKARRVPTDRGRRNGFLSEHTCGR